MHKYFILLTVLTVSCETNCALRTRPSSPPPSPAWYTPSIYWNEEPSNTALESLEKAERLARKHAQESISKKKLSLVQSANRFRAMHNNLSGHHTAQLPTTSLAYENDPNFGFTAFLRHQKINTGYTQLPGSYRSPGSSPGSLQSTKKTTGDSACCWYCRFNCFHSCTEE